MLTMKQGFSVVKKGIAHSLLASGNLALSFTNRNRRTNLKCMQKEFTNSCFPFYLFYSPFPTKWKVTFHSYYAQWYLTSQFVSLIFRWRNSLSHMTSPIEMSPKRRQRLTNNQAKRSGCWIVPWKIVFMSCNFFWSAGHVQTEKVWFT